MTQSPTGSLEAHFASVPDPRIERTKHHLLIDIITIAVCAVIAGADDWNAIAAFGCAKQPWFKRFLVLAHGIPSHDTFRRVFLLLDPAEFEHAFLQWVQALARLAELEVVAIDGKTLRRSHDGLLGKHAIDMVSAWATSNRLVLGQLKVDGKSNEITAIPELLQRLALHGCIITIVLCGVLAARRASQTRDTGLTRWAVRRRSPKPLSNAAAITCWRFIPAARCARPRSGAGT